MAATVPTMPSRPDLRFHCLVGHEACGGPTSPWRKATHARETLNQHDATDGLPRL